MPYIIKKCANCGHEQEFYHNVKTCRSCNRGDMLISDFPASQQRDLASLQRENKVLRAEVNHLRNELGMGRKYREWE